MTDATALAQKAAAEIKTRIAQLDPLGLDLLFREARSHNAWQDRPVGDDQLRALYNVVKMGPTTVNSSPARFLFLRTPEAKERLKPALTPGNVDKTMSAPVTAIIGILVIVPLKGTLQTHPGCSCDSLVYWVTNAAHAPQAGNWVR